jgi:micrococcal nuclease
MHALLTSRRHLAVEARGSATRSSTGRASVTVSHPRSLVPAHPHLRTAVLATLILLAVIGGSSCTPAPDAAPPGSLGSPGDVVAANTTITRIIDGDTVVVALQDGEGHDEHVRLIGIDTPETKKPDTPVECFGHEASDHLHALLPEGTPVRVERDAESRDRYGRLLAYVYRASDGLFVNLAMVRDGFAAQLTVPPNVAHVDEMGSAAATARQQQKGLWAACAGPHVPAPDTG